MLEFWHKNLSQRKNKQNVHVSTEEDWTKILLMFCGESLNGYDKDKP